MIVYTRIEYYIKGRYFSKSIERRALFIGKNLYYFEIMSL